MNNITELQQTFPSIGEIYKYNTNNILYKIKIKDIINAKINSSIVNWYINRPADMTRCEEIRKYILDSYKQIEGMIYLFYIMIRKSLKYSMDFIESLLYA